MAENKCIMCGNCLAVCPLLRATGREELSPRAKSDLSRLLENGDAELSGESVARLAGLCLGCHRCKAVCPQGVDVPGIVSLLRAAHPNFRRWLWKTWLTNAKALWGAGSTAAKLVPGEMLPEKFGRMLKMLAGLKGGEGLTPFLTAESFPDTHRGERMLLFAGCTATYVQDRWLTTAQKLLHGLGVDVLDGDFRCCGSGLATAGFAGEAGDLAAHNVAVWRRAGRPKVAVFCASCLAGLRGYSGCFESPDEAAAWRESLSPLSGIVQDIPFMISGSLPKAVGYHRPCHADAADSDFVFLKSVLGDRLATATDKQCCGFGGVMQLGAPDLVDAVNRDCWDALGGAEVVVTGCSACATRLGATAPEGVKVGHWLEIIR
jgi:glycolate oxidase iron-sulfur subunit